MVKITWTTPSDNGSPITAYTVEVRKSDLSYVAAPTYCDGSHYSVISNAYCEIPMSVIRTTYGLSLNDVVVARVLATNAYGSGSYATSSTTVGALVVTAPKKPPTNV